ncbi:MAG: usg protein [Elsteraceae bacterium]
MSSLSLAAPPRFLIRELADFRLTTAKILYRLPDHPDLLQSYVWQELDQAPKFPALKRFLDFWERNLEGKLHSVTVAHAGLMQPVQMRAVDAEYVH